MKITYEFDENEKEICRRCLGDTGQEKAEEISPKESFPWIYDPDVDLAMMLTMMTPKQVRRALRRASGESNAEIAEREGVKPRAVRECLARASKAIERGT